MLEEFPVEFEGARTGNQNRLNFIGTEWVQAWNKNPGQITGLLSQRGPVNSGCGWKDTVWSLSKALAVRDKPSPQRYGGKGLWGHPVQRASSIFSYSLSLRPKLTAPFNLAPCCSLQETRGNRNPLLSLNEWIFSLVYLRKKISHSFWRKTQVAYGFNWPWGRNINSNSVK